MKLLHVTSQTSADAQTITYYVAGQIFFASTDILNDAIDFQAPESTIVLDLSQARIWDISAADTVEKIAARLRGRGKTVTFINVDQSSAALLRKIA